MSPTSPSRAVARATRAAWRFWLVPGMGVKRHVAWAIVGASCALVGTVAFTLWTLRDQRAQLAEPIEAFLRSEGWSRAGGWVAGLVVLVGVAMAVAAIGRLNRSLLSHWLERPSDAAAVLHRRLVLARGPRIVAIGGGTGLSLLLRGLREHTSNLTAVVAVTDDGGSSGRLRAAFGMPAPGDLSDCLAALSVDEASLGRLLQYRFERGRELEGHTFGNLLITTLSEVERDFGDALRSICNHAGEDEPNLGKVVFDLDLCEAFCKGYMAHARGFLTDTDRAYLYDAVRLITFELGLRFFQDYLAGSVYFKTQHPEQNLNRARVQFRLCESIEARERMIRDLLASL